MGLIRRACRNSLATEGINYAAVLSNAKKSAFRRIFKVLNFFNLLIQLTQISNRALICTGS